MRPCCISLQSLSCAWAGWSGFLWIPIKGNLTEACGLTYDSNMLLTRDWISLRIPLMSTILTHCLEIWGGRRTHLLRSWGQCMKINDICSIINNLICIIYLWWFPYLDATFAKFYVKEHLPGLPHFHSWPNNNITQFPREDPKLQGLEFATTEIFREWMLAWLGRVPPPPFFYHR